MSVNKEEKNNKNEHRWKQVTLILDVFFFFFKYINKDTFLHGLQLLLLFCYVIRDWRL